MYVRGYLQGSENGRVVTIGLGLAYGPTCLGPSCLAFVRPTCSEFVRHCACISHYIEQNGICHLQNILERMVLATRRHYMERF